MRRICPTRSQLVTQCVDYLYAQHGLQLSLMSAILNGGVYLLFRAPGRKAALFDVSNTEWRMWDKMQPASTEEQLSLMSAILNGGWSMRTAACCSIRSSL